MEAITTMTHATQLHAQIIKTKSSQNDTTTLSLSKILTFSIAAKDLTYARAIFNSLQNPNSYCTNTMIRAYSRSPHPEDALLFFISLQDQAIAPPGPPDNFTFPFLLNSCSRLRSSCHGKQLHARVLKHGLANNRFIQNSLIHFYSTCKDFTCAKQVLDRMTDRDVVSWTSIIDGSVDSNCPMEEILQLFEQMQNDGVLPNDATLVSLLRACADSGALAVGRKFHQIAKKKGLMDSKANVGTALMDMYAKCGCIDSALRIFKDGFLVVKDVFAWTVMISGLASHGRCEEALSLFHQMTELEMIRPDERTITGALCACRNAGWVAEGYRHFNKIKSYGMKPRIQHYGCMVDLLARTGHLDEAENFIRGMPIEPDAILWRTLIWASKIHGHIDRSERLMNEHEQLLLDKDSSESGNFVLLGNVYASAGKWDQKARVRELMAQINLRKPPGCSKIEVNGMIHEFEAGDSGHPEAENIYKKWEEVAENLRIKGYSPKLSEVLLDMEDEERVSQLYHHSEKLAVAYGLISTSPGEKILVVKNLRSCEDCHNAMKFVSKIYNRKIVIRDRIRFHYFSNGTCSCGDYW